jgi:hypothetical protein
MSLHYKNMLSSSSLCKNKEVLARNGGGKFRKEMCLYICISSSEDSLLNMTPPFSSFQFGLGNPFVSRLTFYKFISWVVFDSMLPRLSLCHPYVQEKFE